MQTMIVVEWLKTHPLINRAGLAKAIGVDPGNFHRMLDREVFPEGVGERVVGVLAGYGFRVEVKKEAKVVEKPKDVTLYMGVPIPEGLTGIDLTIWKESVRTQQAWKG